MRSTIEQSGQARLAIGTTKPPSTGEPGNGSDAGACGREGHARRLPTSQPATATAGARVLQWVGACLRVRASGEATQTHASRPWLAGMAQRLGAIQASAARLGQPRVPVLEDVSQCNGHLRAVAAGAGSAPEINPLSCHACTAPVQRALPDRPAGRRHVLLVEDSDVNRAVAEAMLEYLGCTVRAVTDGAQAISALQEECFDLVLMDLRMPVLDGFAATRHIRTRGGAFANVPIVAVTASAIVGDRERCIAAGMDDYLAKPFPMQSLALLVQRWLPVRSSPRALPR